MPYRYVDTANLAEESMVGTGQCVELVKYYANAPATYHWREGARVLDEIYIPVGTAIATFVKGKYRSHPHDNHAALYLGRQGDCIVVMDQWPSKGKISARAICSKGKLKSGAYRDPSNNADAFSIIE